MEEMGGQAEAAAGGLDVEPFNFGGPFNGGERFQGDAALDGTGDRGQPDARSCRKEEAAEGGFVLAHEDADGFVVLSDDGPGGLEIGAARPAYGEIGHFIIKHDSEEGAQEYRAGGR